MKIDNLCISEPYITTNEHRGRAVSDKVLFPSRNGFPTTSDLYPFR